MDAAPTLTEPEMISANLRMILRGLLAALGGWRIEPVLALVLYRRIGLVAGRVERMLVRFQAGRLWRVTHRVITPGQKLGRKPAEALPRRFGWLVQAGGHHAACIGSQLQVILTTPEMTELLAASEQARRIIRPLCRALAVELPWMATTLCTTTTKSVETQRRRTRSRKVLEPFRIPLPRGVLAAARRAGVDKGH